MVLIGSQKVALDVFVAKQRSVISANLFDPVTINNYCDEHLQSNLNVRCGAIFNLLFLIKD